MHDDSQLADRSPTKRGRHVLLGLVIVTLCLGSVPLGAIGYKYQRQVTLIESIESGSGTVEAVPVGPRWIRNLVGEKVMRGFDSVESVFLNLDANGVGLNDLTIFDELRRLSVFDGNTAVSHGREWRSLRDFSSVQELKLFYADISDKDIPCLAELKNLKALTLHSTGISEGGAAVLRRRLSGCKVVFQPVMACEIY